MADTMRRGIDTRDTQVRNCVERGHHDVSVRIAEQQLLPAVRSLPEDGVVLADGFSCRTQLTQLAGRNGLHLAELLAQRLPAPAS